MNGSDEILAEFLGIEMPVFEADELEVVEVYTENLAEIVIELSNAELVKNEDALLNPANYRLAGTNAVVRHVHLDGDNVVLTLVPYGKMSEQGDFDVLTKGKLFHLTIRNVHRDINKNYNNNLAVDNTLPVVEDVDFMGDYGIKVTTSEPIANPEERNFRLDSRTAMIVEQYGRDIILTPYHGKAFDNDAVELTIDLLNDFAGYKTVKETHDMKLSDDEGLPKVERAYRSGNELVVVFDRDVYHKSVEAYQNRRELGNVSFVERRVPFYATDAVKVDTNVVKYTFEREIPKNIEVVVEGVANHFNKAMEKEVVVPEEYKDDFAPVVISTNHNVTITQDFEDILVGYSDAKLKEELNKGFEAKTGKTTIIFDKDIAQFVDHIEWEKDNSKGKEIDPYDFFKLYELDITRRGETAAEDVKINVVKVQRDRIELSYEDIKVNNKDRDYDYILEVRNLSDLNGNRMDRDYLDFQVVRPSDKFDVVIKGINKTDYFNRKGIEIVLEFNYPVNKEEASNWKNYYLKNELAVDEAIVERDGKTVSLVVYDYSTVAEFLADYDVLEISPRVEQLDWPYPSVQNRFWDLKAKKPITDLPEPLPEEEKELVGAKEINAYASAVSDATPSVKTTDELKVGDKILIKGLAEEFELENAVDQTSFDALVAAINAKTSETGIVAENESDAVKLTKADGTEFEFTHVSGDKSTAYKVTGTPVSEEVKQVIALTFDGVPAEIEEEVVVKIGDKEADKEGKVTKVEGNVVTITLTKETTNFAGPIKQMIVIKGNATYTITVKDAATGVEIN